MRCTIFLAATAALALGGCGGEAGGGADGKASVIKRQPGSWSSTMEIVKLEGPDVQPGQREQMQQMFAMMSGITVCVTPEAAAKEDPGENLEKSTGSGDCTFDKKEFSAGSMNFSGTCTQNGRKTRMTAVGTNSATASDVTMKIEPLDAAGKAEGVMEMKITSKRNGECTDKDFTPPAEPAKTPAAKS